MTVENEKDLAGLRQVEAGMTTSEADGSLATQYEHTIVITQGHPMVVRAL